MMRRLFHVASFLVVVAACGDFRGPPRPPNTRVVKVRLVPQDAAQDALGGTRSVQLAAVRVEGGQVAETRLSSAEDPRTVRTLSVSLSSLQSYNLFIQSGSDSGSVGRLVGRLLWSEGTSGQTGRLRQSTVDVDLGEVTVESSDSARLTDNIFLVSQGSNPLRLTDRDQDGTNDLDDDDDDSDGALDSADPDADDDGEDDHSQSLASLPDVNGREDGDQVPDMME